MTASPTSAPALRPALEDVIRHLARLGAPRFASRAGLSRLPDVERYLNAVDRRLDKLPGAPRRDLDRAQRVQALQRRLDEATIAAREPRPAAGAGPAALELEELEEVRWMLEELRVSMFAQSLGTRMPVSEGRVERALEAVGADSA